ncbi:MAG: hypothetical protein K2W92_05715 [Alphaproteobacteria bacterium]|nr:hypothetical protein [Alphaproteobacteria bacterium]
MVYFKFFQVILLSASIFIMGVVPSAALEDDGEETKKILYLHVGTHKTGTSAIQVECDNNRSTLKALGVLYADSVYPETNHHGVAGLVMRGEFDKVIQYIRKIKEEARDYNCVLLSSEVFAFMCLDPKYNFELFLKSLREHFAVKFVYCDRDFSDRIASLATYLAILGGNGVTYFPSSDHKSIDDFIKFEKEQNDEAKQLFASQGAIFLSYEDLKKGNTLVESFLKEAVGIDISIPDSYYNTTEELYESRDYSTERLKVLEDFYDVTPNTFVHTWEQTKKGSRGKFAKLITTLTKDRAVSVLAASDLSTAEETSRLDQLNTLIGDPKYALNSYKIEVQRAALKLKEPDFASRLLSIQQNKGLLEDFDLGANDHLNTISVAFTLAPDQIDARLALIKQYIEYLFPNGIPAAEESMASMLNRSIDEIYQLAQSTYYRNYFDKIFLPQMGDRFREILKSKLSDQALSQMILGSTNDYSPEVVKDKLSTFSSIFEEMYILPPSFEKPHGAPCSSVADVEPSSSYQHVPAPVPVPLKKASYNPSKSVVTEENGITTVRTDNKGLHKYQLESERIPVTPGDRLKISYNITSSEDGIVLGLLSTHRDYWLPDSRVALRKGPQQGTVEVKVPEGESVPFFVFYNDQTHTPSTEVTIHGLTIEKE